MTDQHTPQQPIPAAEEINTRLAREYDPRSRMTKIKGQWYLEVRHRVAWFRSEFPHGKIETGIHHVSAASAVVHATVTALDANGTHLGTGSGIGSCTKQEFDAYIEKAETKAIGRALASLGYGTQFSLEYDDAATSGGSIGALADGPVAAPNGNGNQPVPFPGSQQARQQPQGGYQQPQQGGYGQQQQGSGTGPGGYPLASGKQWGMINGRARENGLSESDIDAYIAQTYNADRNTLGKRDASQLIDAIAAGQVRPAGGGAHAAEEQVAAAYGQGGDSMDDVPF